MANKVNFDFNTSLANPLGTIIKLILVIGLNLAQFLINSFLFLLPLGVYITLLQFTKRMISVTAISAYIKEGEFMFIYPNTALVTTKPNLYKNNIKRVISAVDNFVAKNYRLLNLLFGIIVLFILALIGVSVNHALMGTIVK